MPIYEYECTVCAERREFLQRFNDEPIKTCPSCGGELRRLISNSSFILKGSGWYLTDYARKGNSGNGGKGEQKKEESTAKTSAS